MNNQIHFYVPRTCTENLCDSGKKSLPLESYRDRQVYVLLGDSGSGKTTAFKEEAEKSDGNYITARNFITSEGGLVDSDKPLFIDALDEMRAGGENPRTPIDKIRKHLQKIKSPFRLSCREADWLGENDSQALRDILPGNIEPAILHLDPLTEQNIEEILKNKNVHNPGEFISKARGHYLKTLLANPQVLNLLIDAVEKGNIWPESRKEIYKMACQKLVTEENHEHRYAKLNEFSDRLLHASEYLCAIQLLSGIAGFAQDKSKANKDYFEISALQNTKNLPLRDALKTNLFQTGGEERRIPVHRSVAEYLGARYLAKLVNSKDNPLPFERVLALMPNETGFIASDLRGLCAWLAVHCVNEKRKTLINRDPLGIITYGDARVFSVEDKTLILDTFRAKEKIYGWPNYNDPSFGVLGTVDMVSTLQAILSSPSCKDVDQKLLIIALSALAHGESLDSLESAVEKIIRDSSYESFIRANAVDVLGRWKKENTLLVLAKDICTGVIEDRDNEVLGELLHILYPSIISPAEIWQYLHTPTSHLVNKYTRFLHDRLVGTKQEDLPILLDGLIKKMIHFTGNSFKFHMMPVIGKLLVRALKIYGETISTQQLYEWLGLGINEHGLSALGSTDKEAVEGWFAKHPDHYKAIIEYGTSICKNDESFLYCMLQCYTRLQKASPPKDMVDWYLKKARLEWGRHLLLSKHYLEQAFWIIKGTKEVTDDQIDFLKVQIKNYPGLLNYLTQLINPSVDNWNQINPRREKWGNEEQKKKSERAANFRKHIISIREGIAPPSLMYDLSQAYTGKFSDINGATPDKRLEELFDNDLELVDAANMAFKSVLNRKDLPTAKEVINLTIQGKIHLIRSACLISVSLLYEYDKYSILKIDHGLLEALLVFQFSEDVGNAGDEREWVKYLINESPALVKQIFVEYVSAMIKANKEHITPLWLMLYGPYSSLAPSVIGQLLKSFPLRASQKVSENVLSHLIKAAIEHLDPKVLKTIIQNKLKNRSIDAIQKVYWLACGFIIEPDEYTDKLLEHISKKQNYKKYIEDFFQSDFKNKVYFSGFKEKATFLLIELLASECSPEQPLGVYSVTPAMQTANFVHRLIREIYYNSSYKSIDKLQYLMTLESISTWHPILEKVLYSKQIAQSISSFKYLKVDQICHTLENEKPANAADLSALTVCLLREIAKNIRDGNTNDYKQYWNANSGVKLNTPKHENDCRDVLLSDLNFRLGSYGVEGHKEGNYADDKRADIKVSFNRLVNVPVEIKKDCHDDLWKSIHEQLIKKYTRDPGTSGYGIYLVFWFGGNDMPSNPRGGKIKNAKELEDCLLQTLNEEESQFIQILVIDCALPS